MATVKISQLAQIVGPPDSDDFIAIVDALLSGPLLHHLTRHDPLNEGLGANQIPTAADRHTHEAVELGPRQFGLPPPK